MEIVFVESGTMGVYDVGLSVRFAFCGVAFFYVVCLCTACVWGFGF